MNGYLQHAHVYQQGHVTAKGTARHWLWALLWTPLRGLPPQLHRPPTSNVLPIFERAGVRLHDRIEDRMDNDRNTNFHEQVSDSQPGFPLFKKRGTRGGVKHKKTPAPTGGSLGPT
jgi:hypothetical protein